MRRLFSAIIILCLVWVLIPLREAVACSINVIETEYTTFVSTKLRWGPDWPTSSRTTVSSTPISDYVSQPGAYPSVQPLIYSGARANLFDISVFSAPSNWGTAYANAELRFSPLMDASESLQIHFAGWDHWFWSDTYVSLLDTTSNQELWKYDWGDFIQNIDPISPVSVIANFWTIDTIFYATHTYELNMFTQVFPAGDPAQPTTTMQLFGLEPVVVPIPSTILLLCSGLLGLIGCKRKNFRIR